MPRPAFSSLLCRYSSDLLPMAGVLGLSAVEWDLNFLALPVDIGRRKTILGAFKRQRVAVLFHLPYTSWNPVSTTRSIRALSLLAYRHYLQLITVFAPTVVVVHLPLSGQPTAAIARDLRELFRFAERRKICLVVENLTKGYTAECNNWLRLGRILRAPLALDTGHALKAQGLDFFKHLEGSEAEVRHVHFYGFEDDYLNHRGFRSRSERNATLTLLGNLSHAEFVTVETDSVRLTRGLLGLLERT